MSKGYLIVDMKTGAHDGVYKHKEDAVGIAKGFRERHPQGFWIVVQIVEWDDRHPKDTWLPNFHLDALGWETTGENNEPKRNTNLCGND